MYITVYKLPSTFFSLKQGSQIASPRAVYGRLVGITTDGAPSMTGKKNGLVALVQRKLVDENADPAVVLHCIIHQQALCSKCLKYEHVMSVVPKCINYIRSRSLQHRQFRPFFRRNWGNIWWCTLFYSGALAQQGKCLEEIFWGKNRGEEIHEWWQNGCSWIWWS